jgi:hemolysin III
METVDGLGYAAETPLALRQRATAPVMPEELVNALTHGLGVVASLAGALVLVQSSLRLGEMAHTAAVALYAASLVAVFTASSLYHGVTSARWKPVLRWIDRSCIFTLIAGTYTPFAVSALTGRGRLALLCAIWGACIAGTLVNGHARFRSGRLSVGLYLLAAVPAAIVVHLVHPLPSLIGPGGAALVIGGGACYAAGLIFYVQRAAFMHAVWHVWVLLGSALHYAGVLLYATPR